MKHLSGVDASFLHLETPEMPMHVGSLNIFDLPEGYDGDFYEDVKAAHHRPHASGRGVRAQARADALRAVEPGVGGRRRRRHRLPHPQGHAVQARHLPPAGAAGRPPAFEPARSQPAAVGVLRHRGPADRAAGHLRQGAPRRGRRAGRRGAGQGDLRHHAGAAARSSCRAGSAATSTSWASPSLRPRPCRTRCSSTSSSSPPSPTRCARWRASPSPSSARPRRRASACRTTGRSGRRRRSTCRSPTSARSRRARCRWTR